MNNDFNEKFNSLKLHVLQYLKLYNIPVDVSLYLIYVNNKNYPNIKIIFYYDRYIHDEKPVYSVQFENDKYSGSCCPCNSINEVLEELKRLCNDYFRNFKKKYLQLSLFDL